MYEVPAPEANVLDFSRRSLLGAALGTLAYALVKPALPAAADGVQPPAPRLVSRALEALERHRDSIPQRDVIGIADFSLPSRTPRFHVLNLFDGTSSTHLVAHGRGSDPEHTGWLQCFSNEPHSNATSAGAYRTGDAYLGGHGRSIHLEGLDPSNSNAAAREIVVHAAWYVGEDVVGHFGMLGRSQGCLAVARSSLDEILAKLGPGRLIYAGSERVPIESPVGS